MPRFTWVSTLLAEAADELFATVGEAMVSQAPFTAKARYRRADGVVRILLTRAQPRFAPNGEFLGVVGVNEDVTEAETAVR